MINIISDKRPTAATERRWLMMKSLSDSECNMVAEYRRKKGSAAANDPYFWIHVVFIAAVLLVVAYLIFFIIPPLE